jgi:hypothetical protein
MPKAFKVNPFEFSSGAVKIGVMAGIPSAGRQNNTKLPFA